MHSKRELTVRAVLVALVAGVAIAVALVVATSLSAILAYVLGIGLTTFVAYGYDKLQARRRGHRIPERALLTLSVIGGALGGWAGMLILRHKTLHTRFWIAQGIGTIVIAVALWQM